MIRENKKWLDRDYHLATEWVNIWWSQHFVKTSAPVLVIKIVCSNCAARLPSAVTVVHPSSQVMLSMLPMVRMGSVKIELHKKNEQISSFIEYTWTLIVQLLHPGVHIATTITSHKYQIVGVDYLLSFIELIQRSYF